MLVQVLEALVQAGHPLESAEVVVKIQLPNIEKRCRAETSNHQSQYCVYLQVPCGHKDHHRLLQARNAPARASDGGD